MEEYINYITPELLALVPVMYIIGAGLKKSKIADKFIPVILGAVAVILSGVWVFANCSVSNAQEAAAAVFTAITQGVLVAGASVYVNQIIKQVKKDE